MNTHQLLPHLYYFLIVSKHKSFSKAAREMHMSASAISYQVKMLEEKVGMMLLNRNSGQRSELTLEGKHLSNRCHEIIKHLDEALSNFVHEVRSKKFKITAPITFGNHHLLPAIEMHNEHFQKDDFTIILTDDVLDISEEGIDLAIRNVPTTDKTECEKLMRVTFYALASLTYLKKTPKISSPSDLNSHILIDSYGEGKDWARVAAVYPVLTLPLPASRHLTNNLNNNSVLAAVREHQGIALLPSYVVKNLDLEKLGLEIVLPDYINETVTESMDILYACYPKLSIRKTSIIKLITLLRKYLASSGEQLFELDISANRVA